MITELQIIGSAEEVGDLAASLAACQRAAHLIEETETVIRNMMQQKHRSEVTEILDAMPFRQRQTGS